MLRLLLPICLLFSFLTMPSHAQDNGLKTLPAAGTAEVTIAQLERAIKARGMKVFTKIDHSAAASEFGLKMPASTVVIFGNPKGGTPNFLKKPTLAIDLPLKMLVWSNSDGQTFVTYNTGAYVLGAVFARHGLKPPAPAVQSMEKMLSRLAAAAAK